MVFVYKKLAQFAVRCALPPRRSESPVCATDNKPSCVLHLLGWFIGSRSFSSLEWRPKFWVLHLLVENLCFCLSHQLSVPLGYLHLDTSLPSMLGMHHIGEFSNYLSTFSMTAQKSELLTSNIFHFLWYLSWYIYSVFQTHTISWRIGKYFSFVL